METNSFKKLVSMENGFVIGNIIIFEETSFQFVKLEVAVCVCSFKEELDFLLRVCFFGNEDYLTTKYLKEPIFQTPAIITV